jgi:hypothetical protein
MSFWNWLIHRKKRQADLDEEVQAHLRMAAQERMEQGETAEQARASAVREFGNVALVKEVTRDMWGFGWLETLLQDARYGLRQLRRNPGFTAVAALTLALGIGANTAVFSIIHATLLKPLPFRDPARLVLASATFGGTPNPMASAPDYYDYREQADRFEGFSAVFPFAQKTTVTGGAEPERVSFIYVAHDLFRTLGVAPAAGRWFAGGGPGRRAAGCHGERALRSAPLRRPSQRGGSFPGRRWETLHGGWRHARQLSLAQRRRCLGADASWRVCGRGAKAVP